MSQRAGETIWRHASFTPYLSDPCLIGSLHGRSYHSASFFVLVRQPSLLRRLEIGIDLPNSGARSSSSPMELRSGLLFTDRHANGPGRSLSARTGKRASHHMQSITKEQRHSEMEHLEIFWATRNILAAGVIGWIEPTCCAAYDAHTLPRSAMLNLPHDRP